jgi:DNA-directed RNA polymerase specialized sigma24 family protein
MKLEQREKEEYDRSTLKAMLEDLRSQVAPRSYQIFERIKMLEHSPASVAKDLNIERNTVDNAVYRCLKKLKELAQSDEYKREIIEQKENHE